MRIGRAIVIPAILTLGVAGSALVGTATTTAAVHASNVHVVAQGTVNLYFHT